MSEDPDALCTWLVAWLEPDVGRDLGLSAADLRAWVGERVLPRVRAAASEHAIPGGAGASVERVLAGVATFVGEAVRDRADPGSEAPRHFLGRGRGIHRDLGGWLRSRLDEQLQRGMLGLDALLGPQSPSSLESRLELARAVRAVGREVIDVLARLEDGRRSRWRRPKLVLEPGTLVSLGLVPVALHDAIIDCLPQRQRWRERLSLRDAALAQLTPARKDALVVDTRLLPAELAARVVAGLPPPVLASASMAIHADNVDALRLLQVAAVRARCVFIDPPYNTGGHDFGYDDYFPGGSWAAMMGDRLELLRALLTEDGVLVATIDDGEVATLRGLLERVFGPEHFVTQAVWHKKYARQNDATWFSTAHDHVLVAARDKAKWRPHRVPRTAEQNKGYRNPDDDPR
ncbi:MAG: DNA methyltransferase, partial [Nannocystaceae bacterium]